MGVVQSAANSTNAATTPITVYLPNTRKGSSLVVLINDALSSDVINSVTDSLNNTYTADYTSTGSAPASQFAYHCDNNPGGACEIIVANNGNQKTNVIVYEVIGGALTVDKTDFNHALTATPSISTAVFTFANEILFALVANKSSATYTAGAGYSGLIQTHGTSGSADVYGAAEYLIMNTTAGQTPGFTQSAAASWNEIIVSYYINAPTAANTMNVNNISDLLGDDGDYFVEYGSEYMVRQYRRQNANNTDKPSMLWKGRTTYDTRVSPMYIQIYNYVSEVWETLAIANTIPPDTEFSVSVTQSTNPSNYYDSRLYVAFRSYQQVM